MRKYLNSKFIWSRLFVGVCSVGLMVSCSDLEIEETDSKQSPGFQGVGDVDLFISGIYNSLNGQIGDQANLYALSEVTTDAQLVPTRGSDWGDNGIWRQLHQHDWRTDHQYITNTFNQWNQTQFAATQVLSDLSGPSAVQAAHASFLRALGVFFVLDNFGQVPVRDPEASLLENPEVLTGQAAVDLMVSDLNPAIANLPSSGPGSGVGTSSSTHARATKEAAQYLLAKVLLNKHIYLGTEPDQADLTQVVSLVDAITAQGYALEDDYFDIFRNELDSETIWFIPTSVGNRMWNGLHYNQAPEIAGGGWNGFSTLAEYYDMFEGDPNNNEPGNGQEERRGYVPTSGLPVGQVEGGTDGNDDGYADGSNVGFGFLVGQQYDYDGSLLNDRGANPLTFKKAFTDGNGNSSLINNSESTGIRMMKYNPRYGGFTEHEIFFRYADAYLMKAEAMMRLGQDATAMVNTLRTTRGASALNSVTEDDMLAERGRELYAEFWRRNDMIRFGQYTRNWELKASSEVGNSNRNLFPIPASQLILNPNLTQNPGY